MFPSTTTALTVLAACGTIVAARLALNMLPSVRRQEEERKEKKRQQALKDMNGVLSRLGKEHGNSDDTSADAITFSGELRCRGLWVVEERGDGSCLFRGVSRQIYGTPRFHRKLRMDCIDHMKRHKTRFSAFVTKDFTKYLEKMKSTRKWGGELEIRAMEEMLDRHIIVHSPGRVVAAEPTVYAAPAILLYTGRSHYDSILSQAIAYPLPPRGSNEILRMREA